MEVFIVLLIITLVFIYFMMFYLIFFKTQIKHKRDYRFHNAILSIYDSSQSVDDAYEQLLLNFNKLCQDMGNNNETTLLDILEKFIYYYDTYSKHRFSNLFRVQKSLEIRNFIFSICKFIKDKDPFTAVPSKEANLLKNINDAIEKNNADFGKASLSQLSNELINKEKLLKKKEKEYQLTFIISIVGMILTIFFGILSI